MNGDTVVTCITQPGGSEYRFYEAASGKLVKTLKFDDANADLGATIVQPSQCLGKWNANISKRVYIADVDNNGSLPAVNDGGKLKILGQTASSGGFAAARNDTLDARFGPDGHVWWIDNVASSTSNDFFVYRDDAKVHEFKNVADNSAFTLELNGSSYALRYQLDPNEPDPSLDYWLSPDGDTGFTQLRQDPFPTPRSITMAGDKLQSILPATDESLGGEGFYNADRLQVYFTAGPGGTPDVDVWEAVASGGSPTKKFRLQDPLENLMAVLPQPAP